MMQWLRVEGMALVARASNEVSPHPLPQRRASPVATASSPLHREDSGVARPGGNDTAFHSMAEPCMCRRHGSALDELRFTVPG